MLEPERVENLQEGMSRGPFEDTTEIDRAEVQGLRHRSQRDRLGIPLSQIRQRRLAGVTVRLGAQDELAVLVSQPLAPELGL